MTSSKGSAFVTLVLALLLTAACSRQPALQSLDDSPPENPQLPFERAPNRSGIPPTTAIPVHSIPAGTPITIRLRSPLSSTSSHAGDSFEGVLDEPIIIQGQTVVPRGAGISGRVVAAKPSEGSLYPGYLRLTLSAIAQDGKSQAIQTNSVFAKGSAQPSVPLPLHTLTPVRSLDQAREKDKDVQFSTGERFTFRLKETLPSQG